MAQSQQSKISDFNKLLVKLVKHLQTDDVKCLKFLCDECIPAGELEDLSTLQIFTKLKERGKLNEDDCGWLIEFLETIENKKLLGFVRDYEARRDGKNWARWKPETDPSQRRRSHEETKVPVTNPEPSTIPTNSWPNQIPSDTSRQTQALQPSDTSRQTQLGVQPSDTSRQTQALQPSDTSRQTQLGVQPSDTSRQTQAEQSQQSLLPTRANRKRFITNMRPTETTLPTECTQTTAADAGPHSVTPSSAARSPGFPNPSPQFPTQSPEPPPTSPQSPIGTPGTSRPYLSSTAIESTIQHSPANSTRPKFSDIQTPSIPASQIPQIPYITAPASQNQSRSPAKPVGSVQPLKPEEHQGHDDKTETIPKVCSGQTTVPKEHVPLPPARTNVESPHLPNYTSSNTSPFSTTLSLRSTHDSTSSHLSGGSHHSDLTSSLSCNLSMHSSGDPDATSMNPLKLHTGHRSDSRSGQDSIEVLKRDIRPMPDSYVQGSVEHAIREFSSMAQRNLPSVSRTSTGKLHVDSESSNQSRAELPSSAGARPKVRDATSSSNKSIYDRLADGEKIPDNPQRVQATRKEDQIQRRPIHDLEAKKERLMQIKEKLKECNKKTDITLYDYQRELAEDALEGKNCIICAPTGSGKTLTAGYVCYEMWTKAQAKNANFKALFIVCIRNLISQQKEALQRLFQQEAKEDRPNIVEGINETSLLKEMMSKHDIVVLTAQILVNCLKNKEVTLQDVDLLIMDECHHTNLSHPYNVIMEYYHEDRRRRQRLPQILGLTASLGVGADKDNAKEHYILMCANLNCTHITHVRDLDNREELLKQNPRPKKDQVIGVSPRDANDVFIIILTYLMAQTEKLAPVSLTPKPQRASQAYENWAVQNRMEAEKTDDRDAICIYTTLSVLNNTWMAYDDLQAVDVLPILQRQFETRVEQPSRVRREIYELYDQQEEELRVAAETEKVHENQKLDRLSHLLHDLYSYKKQAKGILLTRTRATVYGLLDFIERQATLKDLVRPSSFVGQGRGEGTMTDRQQDHILASFKRGQFIDRSHAIEVLPNSKILHSTDEENSYNLLVATDVAQEGLDMPQCNFVIRYNFVSNEIGSVQSKGRARAKNSECYLIVNKNSTNEIREYENLEKEHLMLEALEVIDEMDSDDLRRLIKEKQEQLFVHKQNKQKQKALIASLFDAAKVTVHCKDCKELLCTGEQMRKRGSNFIVVGEDFKSRVVEKPRDKPLLFRYDSHVGYTFCRMPSCERQLGPKIKYEQGSRLYGYALSKDAVMWKFTDEPDYRQIKQWSKVPFDIAEEKLTD